MTIEQTIESSIKTSYDLFRKQYVAFVIATLIAFVGMIFVITIPPLIFGIYYMCVKLIDGKQVMISDVFKGFNYFLRSWGIFIVAILAIMIGLFFLVIPGLALIILLQYTIAIALLENKGIIASLRRSSQIGIENFTFSIVFLIILSVIQSIGAITRIGVLLTFSFTILCVCVATKKLAASTPETVKKKPVKHAKKKEPVETQIVETPKTEIIN